MTYDHKDLNRMEDQNLDQNPHTSAIKTEKNKDSSTKAKAVVRFSEPIAEYRLISNASSCSSIFSDAEQVGDESRMDTYSWATKGLKKCLWKVFIYICMFIFIGVIILCGFFSDHVVVQTVIFPVGVVIVFCFLFYRAVTVSSYYSGSSVSGFSQREDGDGTGDLEEGLLEDYDGYRGYENISECGENDIKSSI
jgi:hypothetical protein